MRKPSKLIALLTIVSIISACTPKFYPDTQEIYLPSYLDETTTPQIFEEGQNIPLQYSRQHITIKRGPEDKTLIIKREGFEDYKFKLSSQKFSQPPYQKGSFTVAGLTLIYMGINGDCFFSKCQLLPSLGMITVGILTVPFGIVIDTLSPLGIPFAAASNPDYEYTYEDTSNIYLKPTSETRKKCSGKSFLSNKGCTRCDIHYAVLSSAEECARCPQRAFSKPYNNCILKTK